MTVRRPKVIDANGNDAEHVATEAVGFGHLCGVGASPAIAATGLPTGATVSLTAGSTDSVGEVMLTTALVSVAVGLTITVTYATPYANRPFVSLSAVTTNAISSAAANGTTTGFTITLGVSVAVSSTMKWTYQVMGQTGG